MPVNKLPSPCWTAGGTEEGQHYPGKGDDRIRLPEPCLVAVCDGRPGEPCGELLGNDEFAPLHFASLEEARRAAAGEEWSVSPGGVVRCPDEARDDD